MQEKDARIATLERKTESQQSELAHLRQMVEAFWPKGAAIRQRRQAPNEVHEWGSACVYFWPKAVVAQQLLMAKSRSFNRRTGLRVVALVWRTRNCVVARSLFDIGHQFAREAIECHPIGVLMIA